MCSSQVPCNTQLGRSTLALSRFFFHQRPLLARHPCSAEETAKDPAKGMDITALILIAKDQVSRKKKVYLSMVAKCMQYIYNIMHYQYNYSYYNNNYYYVITDR